MKSICFLVMFLTAVKAQNDLSVHCGSDDVTVRWRPRLDSSDKLDLSRAKLENCPPSFLGSDETLHFYASLQDCGFHKQVSVNRVTYSGVLIYDRGPGLSISQSLQCIYAVPFDKRTVFSPEDKELDEAEEGMTFRMELMNSDFSGPAPSLTFSLGSSIPIKAEVHSPTSLLVFLDGCVASTDLNISHVSQVHPVISNSGCLIESKERNSMFLPRRMPSELRLYLEAFKFALGEKVFLHCDLTVRDIQSLIVDGKACHYVKEQRRWELLDDPSQSSVCSCCELACLRRTDVLKDVFAREILGPFIIVEDKSENSLYTRVDEGLSESRVWLLVMLVTVLLVVLMGVLAASYYLYVWRGGRVGYRPRRDLLRKY